MEVAVKQLKQIIEGSNQFRVPHYQRPYSWKKDQWSRLWDDLDELVEDIESEPNHERRRNHFLGSIVTMPAQSVPAGITKFTLIDGQQRLTTLLLLLAALRDEARAKGESTTADRIQQVYLTNQFQEGNDRFKLLPTEGQEQGAGDRRPFVDCMCEREPESASTSLVGKAWTFFRERAAQLDADRVKMFVDVAVAHLQLVTVGLHGADNPYAIFESLNATGKPLAQADLVRNHFFMKIHERHHDAVYREAWLPMEAQLGADAMTEFLRQFLIMRNERFVREDGVYIALKQRLDQESEDGVRLVLKELVRHAGYYARLTAPEKHESSAALRNRLLRLNTVEATVAYPFALAVFDAHSRQELSIQGVHATLDVIENFLVRRYVCDVPRSELNKLFPVLFRLAKRQLGKEGLANLAGGVKSVLVRRRYPTDADFRDRLLYRDTYRSRDLARARLLLDPLILGTVDPEAVSPSGVTIEHILPQTLTTEWRARLGPDADDLSHKWLHTLGNLTLTGHNSVMSNSDWPFKREELAKSNINENRDLANHTTWDADAIQTRGLRLVEQALAIWPHLAPDAKGHASVKGQTPRRLRFCGNTFDVTSWQDVLRETFGLIATLDPDCLQDIARDHPQVLRSGARGLRTPRQLGDRWHYESNLSADSIHENCKLIAQYAGLADDWDVEIG